MNLRSEALHKVRRPLSLVHATDKLYFPESPSLKSDIFTCKRRTRFHAFRAAASRLHIKPKRGYSQNFLVDESISHQIAADAELLKTDTVFEIGPGTGNLTHQLLRCCDRVIAIEADPRLQEFLADKYQQELKSGALQLINADVTKMDMRKVFGSDPQKRTSQKVVANLPFNITTDVLKLLLPLGDVISELFLMLQLEAAQRLSGGNEGNSDYRAMSVMVEFYSQATAGLQIHRSSFEPQPNVDCQMVRFNLKHLGERLEVPSEHGLLKLVNISFSSRRKTLRNNLKSVFPVDAVDSAMQSTGLKETVRPQELTVEAFAALARCLNS